MSGRQPDEDRPRGLTRRTLLRRGALGLGGLVAVATVGTGVRGALNGAFQVGVGAPYDLWSTWADVDDLGRHLVAAGVLAANPHNTQPWTFAVADGTGDRRTIDVHEDPTRTMPVNDASGREHLAGIGCAVTNMVVAAAARGAGTTVAYLPDGPHGPAARVTVGERAADEQDVALARVLADRHTSRGAFTDEPVEADVLAELATQAARDGVRVQWVVDPDERAALGALVVDATVAVVADEAMSVEAFSWFRSTRSQVDSHRDGLTLDCQGLDRVTSFAAAVLPASSRRQGDEFWVKRTRDVHTATAAAYAVLVVDDVTDTAAQVAGGVALQRLLLACTAAGLAAQPMNQVTEYLDAVALGMAGDARTAADLAQRWERIVPDGARRGLLLVRVGHPERAGGRSPRRPLADVLV
ncbi:Acg family FMN-binding oxidoreductase [Cellulomonas soli]|uniref:Acg family FMN-binding oxidoreductase n=1 Tax=Cellulomonas soli TaxID=931535 RepID=UPI003F8353D7